MFINTQFYIILSLSLSLFLWTSMVELLLELIHPLELIFPSLFRLAQLVVAPFSKLGQVAVIGLCLL